MNSTTTINTEAVNFVSAMSCKPLLAGMFRLRLKEMLDKNQDESALENWLNTEFNYKNVKLNDLEPAIAYFSNHRIEYWHGHYTLSEPGALFGFLNITEDDVEVNGVSIKNYIYDNGTLTWEAQPDAPMSGTLGNPP